jgi:diguanylate cyclase (GGDEF)-like protein
MGGGPIRNSVEETMSTHSEGGLRPALDPAREETAPRFDPGPKVPCLGLVFPRDLHQCFKIGVAPRTIGCGQSADIVLNGEGIAPVHCRISVEEGRVLVEDLGSPSGTWVDDRRIAFTALAYGQMVRVGHYRFILGERPVDAPDELKPVRQAPGTDKVAGVPNRAWILRRAEQILEARADSQRPITLALLQLDQLEEIHRLQDYRVGDGLLRGVAKLLESRLREKESIGLFGPEKLLLVLPEVDRDDATSRLEGLCSLVRGQSFDFGSGAMYVTLSAGFSTREGQMVESLERFLTEADRALYRARRWGGNQVITLV